MNTAGYVTTKNNAPNESLTDVGQMALPGTMHAGGRQDLVFYTTTLLFAASVLLMLTGLIISLTIGAWPALREFGEAEQAMHVSSLYALGLILFAITFVVLAAAKLMLLRMAKREGTT